MKVAITLVIGKSEAEDDDSALCADEGEGDESKSDGFVSGDRSSLTSSSLGIGECEAGGEGEDGGDDERDC